ncbi:MAG: DUF3352 domain-containing protein [Thermoleophilaceae bacterium]
MKRLLAACAATVAVVAAGCGAGSGSGAGDPARLAPAASVAYASFELAPQGPEKDGFDAAFGKLLGPDPETQIAKGFTDAIKEHGSKLDYEQDVKPWLGDTAAAVVTGVSRDHPDYAVLVASTNDDKARAAIDKDLEGSGATSSSYRGVDYRLLSDGTANAVVDHFLVAGSEAGLKAVVDTSKDGKPLSDTQQWHESVGDRADGKIGLAYVDLKALIQTAMSQLPGAQRIIAPLALGLVQLHPFVATLAANADSLVVDASSPGTPADKRGAGAASSALIESLPADSWGAFALPGIGQALTKITAGLKLNPLIGAQYARVKKQVLRQSGLDLERDVLAGIGDVAGFVRGTSPRTVGGGVVVQARNRAALKRTVLTLPALIARSHQVKVRRRGSGFDVTAAHMPQPIQVRMGGPGVVGAYGGSAMRAALAPSGKLGDAALFRTASAAIGGRPTFFAALGPVLDLVRASGHTDPSFAKAAPHLAHLQYAAVGARREGGTDVIRAVLGLR